MLGVIKADSLQTFVLRLDQLARRESSGTVAPGTVALPISAVSSSTSVKLMMDYSLTFRHSALTNRHWSRLNASIVFISA